MKKFVRFERLKGKGPLLILIISAFLIFNLIVMIRNSRKPAPLKIQKAEAIKGAYFVKVNMEIIKQMYKRWLPNDKFWPTIFLDNIPNFQIGQLEAVRYNIRVLRDTLSRLRSTDRLDPFAEAAFTALSNDPYKWWFPSAESKWKLAYKKLSIYLENLRNGKSHFYPRADNLIELLSQYASLMGGTNTRLINAPPDVKKVLEVEQPSKSSKSYVEVNIPWYKVDDNFYYAQGVAYVLRESFKAIKEDFYQVLKDKNSLQLVDKILEDFRRCDFEPLLVLNGGPGSIFANHSLNLSSIFNDARQKIGSLIVALREG